MTRINLAVLPLPSNARCRSRARMLAGAGVAHAQQAEEAGLEEVVVTAQKRSESLQDVPLSHPGHRPGAARGAQGRRLRRLREIPAERFVPDAAARALRVPTCAAWPAARTPTTPVRCPSVGVYLDEQPITTIQGPLDVQIYDIARVEVLAGPQGTLYGASSQAGTIRIITNKPDPDAFDAGFAVDRQHAGRRSRLPRRRASSTFRSARRPPFASSAGRKHEPGYIDNVRVHARVPDVRHRGRQQRARRGQLQRLDQDRRARRARHRPQRHLDAHADDHGAEDEGQWRVRLRPAAWAISRSRTRCPRASRTSGCRRRSPCRARSATGI